MGAPCPICEHGGSRDHADWHDDAIRAAKEDVVEMLAKRLDLISGDFPPALDNSGFRALDSGWASARQQINTSILNPRVDEHIRSQPAPATRGESNT
jgi:hypothetical protein